MARGKHLFPFRTEQLSPSAPMVLGPQGPGRVGRRRLFLERVAFGRPVRRSAAGDRRRPRRSPARRKVPWMTLELINPDDLPLPESYTHVVVATGTRMVFVAGQV